MPVFQSSTSSSPRKHFSTGSRYLFAGITLALCGIVFGLFELRTTLQLTEENALLNQRRLDLLSLIEESNRSIDSLSFMIDSLTQQNIAVPEQLRQQLTALARMPRANPQTGLPVSFDEGRHSQKAVALTFDGGSFANAARDIIDTLMSRHAPATMFLTGEFIRKHSDVVKLIIGAGFEVGNHTDNHPHLTTYATDSHQNTLPTVSADFLVHELASADSRFEHLAGKHLSHIWRAPYGEFNRQICAWAQEAGWLHIGWGQGRSWRGNLDSNDWVVNEESPGYHTPQEFLDKVLLRADAQDNGMAGGIILMHLGTDRPRPDTQMHQILGRLIDALSQRGYRFVTVTEMCALSGVDLGKMDVGRPTL